jgi:hypothetical protein
MRINPWFATPSANDGVCALRPSIAPSSRGHRRKRAIEF